MDLTDAQRDALLQLGTSASGHDFIHPDVVKELLAMELVYWRLPRDLDFTWTGNQVYKGLAGK